MQELISAFVTLFVTIVFALIGIGIWSASQLLRSRTTAAATKA